MKRTLLAVALCMGLLVAFGGHVRAASSTTTISLKRQTIAITVEADVPAAQIVKTLIGVYVAPGELAAAEPKVVTTGAPYVQVRLLESAQLKKGELLVTARVTTKDRTLTKTVRLVVRPTSGGPYSFEVLRARGVTNSWLSVAWRK